MREDRYDDNACCCNDEVASLLRELADDVCPVELLLAGAPCCNIEGIICDVIKNNCICVIIDTENNSKCFVPVDKIAAVCKKCPGGNHHRPREVE